MKRRLAIVACSILFALVGLEVAARVWVARRWPAELVYLLTHHTNDRGRFTASAEYGYVLRPDFRDPSGRFTHNHLGFRGSPFTVEKPAGTLRIVLMGASTVYGIHVADGETSAARLGQGLKELLTDREVEVINAGVPGWTSLETLQSLRQRVLSLRPDVIVVADGRNDIYPQLFNNYREDYSHYRLRGHSFRDSNYAYKRLFRVSHLLMWLAARGSGHFGFSFRDENPAYAVINYGNRPNAEEMARNAAEAPRAERFRRNLEHVVREARAQGVLVLLSTIPFLPEDYASGVVPGDAQTLPLLARQAQHNNEITRAVARATGALLVDPAVALARPDLLRDECHFNEQGERAFAALIIEALKPALPRTQNQFKKGDKKL